MAGRWYWIDHGETYGPVNKTQLVSLVKRGQVAPATQVRNGDSGPWRHAEDVPGLFQQAFSAPPSDASKKSEDAPNKHVVLGLIIGGSVLVSAILTAVICVIAFVFLSGNDEPVVDEPVAVVEEPVPEPAPFGVVVDPPADPDAEPADVEPAPQQVQEDTPDPQPVAAPDDAADDESETAPPEAPVAQAPEGPRLDPKPILPPIPDEKSPISDREITDFHNAVRRERSAADAHARYIVFSQSHEFTESQQVRVDEELSKWQQRADANLHRLGTEWVALEQLAQAEREASQLIERAYTLIEVGSIDECIDLLEQAGRANPNGIKPNYILGLLYSLPHAGPKAPDLAEKHFRTVLRRQPDHPAALNSIAIAQIKQRQYGPAIAKLTRASELTTDCQEIAQNLGRFIMLSETGRIPVPESVLRRYTSLYASLVSDGRAQPYDETTGYLHMIPVFPSDERDEAEPDAPEAPKVAGELVPVFSGSGFVVAPDYIMTNRHVVFDDERGLGVSDVIGVANPKAPDQELRGTVVAISDDADLALVHMPDLSKPALSLRDDDADLASDVMILGYPRGEILGVGLKATQGVVSALPDPTRQLVAGYYLFDATADSGNSGGPVLDRSGRVVAVLTVNFPGIPADLTGGVTSETARRFIQENLPDVEFDARAADEDFADWAEMTKSVAPSVVRLVCYYKAGAPALNVAVGDAPANRHVFEDYTCPTCNGLQRAPCPRNRCKGGEISVSYTETKRIGQAIVRQRKSRRERCPTCDGAGRVRCPHCVSGYDTRLR